MSLQFDDDDGDLFDDEQDEGEGLASDQPSRPRTIAQAATRATQSMASAASAVASRRMRVRPMTPAMIQKNPQVVSIILTRADGKQLVFIRK